MALALSAKAIARFCEDFKLRPDEAVRMLANADCELRRRVAEKYSTVPEVQHIEPDYVAESAARVADSIAIRLAMTPKCERCGGMPGFHKLMSCVM